MNTPYLPVRWSGPVLFSLMVLSFLPSPVVAAAPDGSGPWADTVVSASQGLMKNGLAVPAARSNPNSALGVAENDTVDGHFYSLGFGGNIVLGFEGGISSGVFVVEATNADPVYPIEKARVEASEDGTTWITAGTVNQDGTVPLPATVTCAKYVRITDISDPSIMPDEIADGYDVDGVKVTGTTCKPKPPHGGSTTIDIDVSRDCEIKQTSTMVVTSVVKTSSKTGGNSIKNTTGGNAKIKTGKATSISSVKVTGGSNVVQNSCKNCGSAGVSISIEGNK